MTENKMMTDFGTSFGHRVEEGNQTTYSRFKPQSSPMKILLLVRLVAVLADYNFT